MKFFKDLFTDNSGDYDVVSVMASLSFVVFFGLASYGVIWKGKDFDMVNYGIAVSSLVAALGAAYHLKSNKEPLAKE